MSFDYQLYTSPWSQLGELKFDGCTFNGIPGVRLVCLEKKLDF
jgi:precorrin-4 methylase